MATVTDPRRRMVRRQIAGRGIADRRVLAAMEKVPREAFLPEAMQEFAYEDTPLPIEEGQTMSQPYIVARMAEAADVSPVDRVLEIGAGSGYAAAVLGELAGRVFTIERHPALADLARAVCVSSATTMSRCARATARWAGPSRRRSTPSSPPPAARACPIPGAPSSPSRAGW